jgi:hypothetical protein
MQFYRGQQGGSAPQRLFLSGGASLMPYTAQFFAEKLNIPVEYFNPFRNVQISPEVNLEELSRVAHALGEVVGLGLRNLANCPVEMNLMPDSTLRWQAMNQKKPYFVATVISLVLVLFAIGFLFEKLAAYKEKEADDLQPQVADRTVRSENFNKAYGQLQASKQEADQITTWLQQRFYWGDFLADMRRALIRSEDSIQKKLSAEKPGIESGIWIEKMTSSAGGADMSAMAPGPGRILNPYITATPSPAPVVDPNSQTATAVTNMITLVCRAVDLSKTSGVASADKDIAFEVQTEIKNSPMVDPKETSLVGNIETDDSNGTFTFTLTVLPLNPPHF